MIQNYEKMFADFFKEADITINGTEADSIIIHDKKLYEMMFRNGSVGFGEAYMDGLWDCDRLDVLFYKLVKAPKRHTLNLDKLLMWAGAKVFNMQNKIRAHKSISHHYNLSNDFFAYILDPSMNYTCGFWQEADSLEQAQMDKMELICNKLRIEKTDTVLDIGSGWGSLAKYMAETRGCSVVGINISDPQIHYAKKLCAGLPVKFIKSDYRDLIDGANTFGKFDKIVSVGMFEHVGEKNYLTYMKIVNKLLKTEGLFLLHTIGDTVTRPTDKWILKYIFPNGQIPSVEQISSAAERLFIMDDLHNFGPDYDKTLMKWHENFERNREKIAKISPAFDERFLRMWKYFLLNCAGAFRARKLQLFQFVFTKYGTANVYDRPVCAYREQD